MALIPHAQGEELARKAIVLDLGDLERQASWIREEAERAAAEYVEESRRERERILEGAHDEGRTAGHEEGHQAGYAEGLAKGREEALAEANRQIEALQASWSEVMDRFIAERDVLVAHARTDLLNLAVSIAERIVRRTIEHDPRVIESQLEAAIGLVLEPSAFVIEIHPQDRAVADAVMPALMRRIGATAHIEIAEHDDVDAGMCRVRTSSGLIDGRISTQIDRIAGLLLGERPRSAVGPELPVESEATPEPSAEPAAETPSTDAAAPPTASTEDDEPLSEDDTTEPTP